MFDGAPEQFHRFMAPRTTLPLHLPFPSFDAYHHHLPLPPPNLLHPLLQHHKDEHHKQEDDSMSLEINDRESELGEHHHHHHHHEHEHELTDSWTHDEVLALLRIRSSMDTWFPELTWEHVSRKLAEVGFKRSAEKCKARFEEETRYFNNNNNSSSIHYTKTTTTIAANNNSNNNYRFISELEQIYQQQQEREGEKEEEAPSNPEEGNNNIMGHALIEDGSRNDVASATKPCEKSDEKKSKRSRHKHNKFEMLKGFCESIVNKIMAQQEQMHNKLLQDMIKIDEDKFAREEAWKNQEIERMNRELEMMAREQALTRDRQAAIIEFLKKFSEQGRIGKEDPNLKTASNCSNSNPNPNLNPNPDSPVRSQSQNPNSADQNPNCSIEVPSSSDCALLHQNPNSAINSERDEIGRRWPREEVLALINLRCSIVRNNNNNNYSNAEEEKEGGNRGPLWERISRGMRELGYERSAKRCKEKWENINKYFRKTKHVSKKRSLQSRTCPYFHHLTTLYSQGKLIDNTAECDRNHNSSLVHFDASGHKTMDFHDDDHL